MHNDRIAFRKAQKRVRVLDAQGQGLGGKELSYKLINHAFLFGCGAFDALALTDPNIAPERRTLLTDRMDKWLELFNYGTLPFYWGRYEPVQGQHKTAEILRAADFLLDKGVTLKGHPLCWHTVCADWLMDMDNADILKTQLMRIDRDVKAFAGRIDMWDVINEVVIMPIFDKYDNAITRVCKEIGRIGIIREVFAAAREANPGATLLLNDFNTSTNYEILLEGCLAAGIPIDAIGIQSHQHQGYWGLEKLQEVLARFDHFGLPIHFTENTLISGDIMPAHIEDLNDWQVESWPTTAEGEARQAREMAEMYTALFEHKQTMAITTWDHVDGKWLGAPSGILRKDNSKKPAHEALYQLIRRDWHTEATLRTDSDGYALLDGFKGLYTLNCDGKTAQVSLLDGTEEGVVLR